MTARKLTIRLGIGLGLASAAFFSACASDPSCQDLGMSCAGNSNGGGAGSNSSGAGGAAGRAGGSGGNVSAGDSGANSSAGASEAGMGGALPCDGTCSGAKPACDVASNTCVECTGKSTCASPAAACDTATNTCVECVDKSTCAAPKPACDTASNTCVECTASTDCKVISKPFCDTTAQQCVACLKQADCTNPTASACNAGACTACTQDADCSNIAGKGVCDAGACVQCTGAKFAACGSSMGTALVCDSLQRTCTSSKQASSDLCQPCVSDAQCRAGRICVQEQFGSPAQSVGYFCFWKKGDTADGAPTTCLPGADPYSATLTNATSIDGTKSDICSLAVSTCIARNQFKNKDCANQALPDDSLCGFAPMKDSKCVQADVGVFRCTTTCLSDDDCPGTSCIPGPTPQVCSLQ